MSRRPAVRCSARAKSTGVQCQRFAMYGASVCVMHGGAAGQVRRKAAERVEAQEIERTLARYAVPREDATPSQVLVEELREAAGKVRWLRERLRGSDAPLTSVEHDKLGAAEDRLHRIASDLARLGIEASMLDGKVAEVERASAARWLAVAGVLIVDALEAVGTEFGWDIADGRDGLARKVLLAMSEQRAEDGSDPGAPDGLDRPLVTLPADVRTALCAARDRAVEAAHRDLVVENQSLRMELEQLRGRVQSDGLSMRLALPAPDGWEPDPFVVADDDAEPAPDVLEGGELIPPDDETPRPSRRRRAPSVLDHFTEARRSSGYRR